MNLIRPDDLPPLAPADLATNLKLRERVDELATPCEFPTESFFHAGCYARVCYVQPGAVLCGAVIKVPTIVVVCGHCHILTGGHVREVDGFAILRGAAGRASIFRAVTGTTITMIYASSAKTVDEAEQEFTDEYQQLLTRRQA